MTRPMSENFEFNYFVAYKAPSWEKERRIRVEKNQAIITLPVRYAEEIYVFRVGFALRIRSSQSESDWFDWIESSELNVTMRGFGETP